MLRRFEAAALLMAMASCLIAIGTDVTRAASPTTYSESAGPDFPSSRADTPAGAILRFLEQGHYERLDAEFAKLHQSGRRAGDFDTNLDLMLVELLGDPRVARHVDDWCNARPESPYAFLVRGELKVDLAWNARSSRRGRDVTSKGRKTFGKYLHEARRDLERSHELDAGLAHAPAALISVAMGLNENDAALERYFRSAVRADASYMSAYRRRLESLFPKWGGSMEATSRFLTDARERMPEDPAVLQLDILLALEAATWRRGGASEFLKQPKMQRHLQHAFGRLVENYPSSGRTYRWLAKYAKWTGDTERGARFRRRAAELGDATSMRNLAFDYQVGEDGVEKNLEHAYRWMRRAAEAGDVKANTDVGEYLIRGWGVNKNEAAAVAWFERGAMLGNAYSMNWLGYLYWAGRGVHKDLRQAAHWYRKAAVSAHPSAHESLAKLLKAHPELREPNDPA